MNVTKNGKSQHLLECVTIIKHCSPVNVFKNYRLSSKNVKPLILATTFINLSKYNCNVILSYSLEQIPEYTLSFKMKQKNKSATSIEGLDTLTLKFCQCFTAQKINPKSLCVNFNGKCSINHQRSDNFKLNVRFFTFFM